MIRGFSDLEIEQIMAAAAPLDWEHRDAFLRAVINELSSGEPGPGSVYQAAGMRGEEALRAAFRRSPPSKGTQHTANDQPRRTVLLLRRRTVS